MRPLILALALVVYSALPARAASWREFPPDVQHIFDVVFAQLPADAQTLSIGAMTRLTPAQAQQAVKQIRSDVAEFGLATYVSLAVTLDQVRQALPLNRQQTFVNGIWGVSPQEQRYAHMVIVEACIRSGAPRDKCGFAGTDTLPPGRPTGTPSRHSEPLHQPPRRMGDILGGLMVFYDPQDLTWEGTYPSYAGPSGPVAYFRCSWGSDVIPSGSPHYPESDTNCHTVYLRK